MEELQEAVEKLTTSEFSLKKRVKGLEKETREQKVQISDLSEQVKTLEGKLRRGECEIAYRLQEEVNGKKENQGFQS